MHEKGYMHLDFKPENVLVSRNGSVRLIDFDLAQPIPAKPKIMSKKNPGTPGYMAPEQLLGQPISQQVDIFSYGVAAYELLTSHKPFPGDTPGEILKKELERADFVSPRQYNADIPVAMENLILKCIELEPERRYPFMGMMVGDLKAALYV
jgi:serine/threonine-protein kinase